MSLGLEGIKSLSNEGLRIKVAKLYGYTQVVRDDGWLTLFDKDGKAVCSPYHPDCEWEMWIDHTPNYPQDLNAMHEAEEVVPELYKWKYAVWLGSHIQVDDSGVLPSLFVGVRPTARQRAEAFALTMMEARDEQ